MSRAWARWGAGVVCAGLMMAGCARPAGPSADNALPFGYVDVPGNGASVARVTRVAGWALDEGHISRVDVYVDGRFAGSTTPSLPRPDLPAHYPAFPNAANAGWEVAIDLGASVAPRQLVAQAVDDRGATRDIGVLTVTVAAP